MEPPFRQFGVLWTAVDSRAAGVGPAVSVVEAQGTLVAVEDPETGAGEAVGDKVVQRSGVQWSSDAATPVAWIEVQRVEVARSGIGALGGVEGRTGRGEADELPSVGRYDDACPWRPGRESAGPDLFEVTHRQTGEDPVGYEGPVGGAPGCDLHGGKGVGVGRRRVTEFDHVPMLADSERSGKTTNRRRSHACQPHRAKPPAQELGFEIVRPLTAEDWGVRRFLVRAPDGNIINVVNHRD